jgi:hypothetical protein
MGFRIQQDGAAEHRPLLSRRPIVTASIVAVAVAGAAVTAVLAGPGHISLSANSSRAHAKSHHGKGFRGAPITTVGRLQFSTLDNAADPTFNQLLGINNRGLIAGYFGSGAAGHPNKGYLLDLAHPNRTFINENFPGSTQTQVTGLNDLGVTVGFWSDMNNANATNANFGFYKKGGRFHTVNFPTAFNSTPPVNQLLGVNDHNVAVGFYTDAKGNNHGYTFSIARHRFHAVKIRGAVSVTATAINNWGDIAGFFTNRAGATKSFLWTRGRLITFAHRGATMTQAFGVNDHREVVGAYTVGKAENALTHGFTWTPRHGFTTVDNPNGRGTTTINGLNNAGHLVGFYTDAKGNTHGFLLARQHHVAPAPMPTATPTNTATATPTATPTNTATGTPTATPTNTATGTPTATPTGSVPPPPSPVPSNQPTHW